MKRVIQYLLISLMFVVPVAGFLSIDPSYVIKSENRTLAKFPKYGSIDYFSDLVRWYADRLFGKIRISENYFSLFDSVYAVDRFSPKRLSVLGESNWFFLGDAAKFVYSQHTRDFYISSSNINKKISFIKNIKNISSAPFYFVVGPDKHGVYSEYLRPYIFDPGKYRTFDKYKHILSENGINYIDNLDCLKNAKRSLTDKQTLYYTNDSHWNYYGAYVAFNNVMKSIDNNYEPKAYSFIFSSNKSGDLTRNIVAPEHGFLDYVSVQFSEKTEIGLNYINNSNSPVKIYENDHAKDDRTVLIMSDSFGGAFAPFAIDYFKTVILLPRIEMEGVSFVEIIKNEKPDLILYVNVERNAFY